MALVHQALLPLLGFVYQGDLGPLTIYRARDGGLVAYISRPPLTPPTYLQHHNQSKWKLAANGWFALGEPARQRWRDAARLASLPLSGFSLFLWHTLHPNELASIQTIERQSHVYLISEPPPP